ncbi:NUDIX domain-containing protein [Streptomyces virginiae]|uniref:NUDIX domain-containing protein n=1 Tax=Streptomyces virginiae TaxID=1961 RepID=UPI003684596D
MSGEQRHRVPVDVHLILIRDTDKGPEVLLSRRAGDVYAAGMWHLVSGHIDGPHEDMLTALIREAHEEAGIIVDPAHVHYALTVHHRGPGGRSRVGAFFEVSVWEGVPSVREPAVCDAMGWFPLNALPDPMVAYCRAGLDTYLAGETVAIHFQEPGDPIAYNPALDRRRPLTHALGPAGHHGPENAVREFAEQAVGRIRTWTDASWPRETSRVWRVDGEEGGVWFVKVHQNDRFHHREVEALRSWVTSLGAAAPRLVAADPALRSVVITALTGRPLHGMALDPATEAQVQQGLGRLAAALHRAAPEQPAGPSPALGKVERHLKAAGPYLAVGDEDLVLALARVYADLPAPSAVPTHGDLQYRNVLIGEDGGPRLLDFERSEYASATRDMVRLSDTWTGRDDLRAAFLKGYGRLLDPDEELRLDCEAAFDAVSGIAYGMAHGDPEVTERGRLTLLRLHTARRV